MKYNVGDRVRVKSLEWYNKNKDEDGDISCGDYDFVSHMTKFCGKVITIKEVYDNFYTSTDPKTDFYWTDEMIEGLVEEETYDFLKTDKPNRPSLNDFMDMLDNEIKLPQGYQFKDENGNIINATKIVLEKKKKEYPKNYYECRLMNSDDNKIPLKIIEEFTKLINARNAYWRIHGREMGLDKPWEPDWNIRGYYAIARSYGNVVKTSNYNCDLTFVFPTEEMRDAFYENFKELINECKELL